jgi:hypothetical protein
LLGKTKKFGWTGIEAQDNPPPPNPDQRRAVEEFFRAFDNPLIREQETAIQADLRARRLEAPEDRERGLVKTLALTQIILHFERVHGSIWASQHTLLRTLNERPAGLTEQELKPFYDTAKAEYGVIYDAYSFERWLGFLHSYKLVAQVEDRYVISVCGREYLQYLVATGKSAPTFG